MFCYFQNTFPFVSVSKKTDDIGKQRPIPCSTKDFRRFFKNKISLPERRNNKNVLFLNLNDKIIEQEMNKLAIHTHVNFRPRNGMFLLLNNYVFPDWQR